MPRPGGVECPTEETTCGVKQTCLIQGTKATVMDNGGIRKENDAE